MIRTVLLTFLLLAMVACGASEETAPPATAVPPTATPAPTATPEPTATAVPPTATPAPTATPEPTATAVPPTPTPAPTATPEPTATTVPPTPTPEPTAIPTSSPSPTSISRVAPSAVLGSEEWWNEIGPYDDYAENVDIGRSDADYVYWLMYGATFALSEWLGGSEPWLGDFAQFVEDTPFLELRDVSNDLFGQMEFVDENTQQWAKPYLSPETANDMNLLLYVGISACLTVNTLDGCLAALQ